jgi:hypothetical protein
MNSRKVINKNSEVTPSEVDQSNTDETVSPPIQMPEEPHRKVFDTSKPARTVTEKSHDQY